MPSRRSVELRSIERFADALTSVRTIEDVTGLGLGAIQNILEPDRAYAVLRDGAATAPGSERSTYDFWTPGWKSEVQIPLRYGDERFGNFVLNFQNAREFTEEDILLVRIIGTLAGCAIQSLAERQQWEERQERNEDVVSVLAHELQGPLTAILGAVHILRADHEQNRERAMDIVERNAKMQSKLIRDLLNLVKTDAGKLKLNIESIDLATILRETVEMNHLSSAVDGRKIFLQLASDPIDLRGDRDRLQQVFSNLLSNAVHFTPDGGQVFVEARLNDGHAIVTVRDTGIGISPESLPRVFERFHQVMPSEPASSNGLGLGLTIVKELVEMHGGSVTAESAGAGRGSTFTVQLPIRREPELVIAGFVKRPTTH